MALDWASVGDSSFRFGGMGASSRHQRTGNPTSLLLARRRAWFFGEPHVLIGTDDQPSPRVFWRAGSGASFQREARPDRGWDACCGENRAYTTILWGTARVQPGRRDSGGTAAGRPRTHAGPAGWRGRVSERPGHPPGSAQGLGHRAGPQRERCRAGEGARFAPCETAHAFPPSCFNSCKEGALWLPGSPAWLQSGLSHTAAPRLWYG